MSPIARGACARRRRLWLVCLAIVLAFCCAWPAHADRDIVYSARYYLRPGSRGHSHFHLYRINPDGTGRTQITFGRHDDQRPVWSPNGRWIAFQRDSSLDLLDMRTLRIRDAFRLPAKEWDFQAYRWSPDSCKIAIMTYGDSGNAGYLFDLVNRHARLWTAAAAWDWSPGGDKAVVRSQYSDKIVNFAPGKVIPVPATAHDYPLAGYNDVIWFDNRTLIGIYGASDATSPEFCVLDSEGHVLSRVQGSLVFDPNTVDSGPGSLMPRALSRRKIVYVRDASISTWSAYDFYLVDLASGATHFMADGQFLVWSPDGERFCTAPHRDLSTYQKLKADYDRDVWTAPLQIGYRSGGTLRTITPGLVYVTGADWRRR